MVVPTHIPFPSIFTARLPSNITQSQPLLIQLLIRIIVVENVHEIKLVSNVAHGEQARSFFEMEMSMEVNSLAIRISMQVTSRNDQNRFCANAQTTFRANYQTNRDGR